MHLELEVDSVRERVREGHHGLTAGALERPGRLRGLDEAREQGLVRPGLARDGEHRARLGPGFCTVCGLLGVFGVSWEYFRYFRFEEIYKVVPPVQRPKSKGLRLSAGMNPLHHLLPCSSAVRAAGRTSRRGGVKVDSLQLVVTPAKLESVLRY